MCGIICLLKKIENSEFDIIKDLTLFENNIRRRGPNCYDAKSYSRGNHGIIFAASVLWLQGREITNQPIEDDKSLFVYNGDIFSGIDESDRKEKGDTSTLFELLKSTDNILVELSKVAGPFAFIYLDKLTERLYFGRDAYGRRSLLIGKNFEETILLSSVARKQKEFSFIELPSIGIFYLDLSINELILLPWHCHNQNFELKLKELSQFLGREIIVKQVLPLKEKPLLSEPNQSDISILKSIEISTDPSSAFKKLLDIEKWNHNVNKLKELLDESVRLRVSHIPNCCGNCLFKESSCTHSKIGVLYSGGVDCSILAALLDKHVDRGSTIDLINVAFDEKNGYHTPDRVTGLQGLEELKEICPTRKWNFVAVDVPTEELDAVRREHIADLIHPLNSILDDSLGCALWFAARGKQQDYTSPCRVLLVGMGADELFGGYTRHRAAFKRKSWLGLYEALNEDWQNLPYRNLARDDRVVSDHGRQLRTPYLDENFVRFVRCLQPWEKTYPCEAVPHGIGEKLLLRVLAYGLGFRNVACFKKRAIQFGSRIANKNENAHDISARLL